MRDVVLLLLLAVIGFGFLLSSTLNLNQELTEARDQLAHLQAQVRTLEAQYQAVVEEKNRLVVQVSGLTGENTDLRARVESLETERQVLSVQIETLQRKLAFVEATAPVHSWLASPSAGRLTGLFVLPMLPLTFGAAYAMIRRNAANSSSIRTSRRGNIPATFHAALTREELHLLAQHRRIQKK